MGQEQGQRAHAQRVVDAFEQPLRHATEVQVRVEVLGQAQQRAPRVVALAEEEAVDAFLDPVLDRAEEERDHHRREDRDDRDVRLLVRGQQDLEQVHREQAHAQDGGQGQDVDERAAEDELDVHQAMFDHGVGQRERDERERDVPGQLHGLAWLAAQGERDRVEEEERHHARARAPHQPLHLLARGQAARPAVGAEQDAEGHREQRGEIDRLPVVDEARDLPQHFPMGGRAGDEQDLARHRRSGQGQRGHVGGGNEPRARGGQAPLREGQAEVEEHDGQEEDRERVRPEQRPVREVELPRVRRRIHEEEEQADRVEVQGGAVRRPPQHHDRAHEQAEEADQREVVEEADVALRERLHRHFERPSLVGAEEVVHEVRARRPFREMVLDLLRAQHLFAVEGEDDVVDVDARLRRGTAARDAGRVHPLRALHPEDAVVHQRPGRLQENVVAPQRGQDEGHGEYGDVLERGALHGHTFDTGLCSSDSKRRARSPQPKPTHIQGFDDGIRLADP